MKPVRCYRLRKPDGTLGAIVLGALPAHVEAVCEGVAWLQIPGKREAVRGELWSEAAVTTMHAPPPAGLFRQPTDDEEDADVDDDSGG